MPPTQRVFSFISMAYPGDTFSVVTYEVQEALCQLFHIEMLLCSKEHSIDFNEILESPANCVIHAEDGNLPLHGVVSEFEQLHSAHGIAFYRAVLSPRIWWLTLAEHNEVFLNMSIPQILEKVLLNSGLNKRDFMFKLKREYPVRELVCQYNETNYNFLLRWIEREGMYYYFERHEDYTTLVITDTVIAHPDLRRHKQVRYTPPSGMPSGDDPEVLRSLVCRVQPVPKSVRLKDHNYRTPQLDLTSTKHFNEQGRGVSYHYGDHFLTPGEGIRLAQVRSEAHAANAIRFHGESTVGALRAGFVFTLVNHFRKDFNQNYMVVSCRHMGNQARYLQAGLRQALEGMIEERPEYENTFSAIPADLQYRPLPVTSKPLISGTLTALIDASGSGQYAELDDQGRYKVILPFDLSGRKDGHASSWLRMMQPYGGGNHGMHMPLHKGTEVLLTFEAGDPDRPVIAGAVPNPTAPSQVTGADQTMCKLTTSGGNKLHIEDKSGSQRFLMQTPTANTWFRMGAPNDPPASGVTTEEDDSGWGETEENTDGFRYVTEGNWYGTIGQHMEMEVGGNSTKVVMGGEEIIILGFDNKTVGGLKTEITLDALTEFTVGAVLDVMLGPKAEIIWGRVVEVNAAICSEIRPEKVRLIERSMHIHNVDTEIHELKTELAEAKEKIAEQESAIVMAHEAIIEDRTDMNTLHTAIGESETRMKQFVEKLAEEDLMLVDAHTSMLQEKIEMLESKLGLSAEHTEITEKVYL